MKLRLALFALALLVMGCEQNPYLVGVGFRFVRADE